MDYPSFKEVEAKLKKSLNTLFLNDKYLFEKDVNERSISHMLAFYLKNDFMDWDVDCEYNREHDNPKRLKDLNHELEEIDNGNFVSDTKGTTVFPDIIIHKRGSKENLLAIEIKKSTSRVKDDFDIKKLRGFLSDKKLKYRLSVFLKTITCKADKVGLVNGKPKWIYK